MKETTFKILAIALAFIAGVVLYWEASNAWRRSRLERFLRSHHCSSMVATAVQDGEPREIWMLYCDADVQDAAVQWDGVQ